MPPDILITTGSEFMVSRAEGETEAGSEFIDSFVPASGGDMLTVVDAGDIVFPDADLEDFKRLASKQGLELEIGQATV